MARWNGKGLSPEEKEQRKEALRQQVEDVVNNFETSPETILNYLKFSSRFHQYSVNNTILIYEQNSMAHFCASYKAFQDMGYQIQKGEVGMKIFVPYISTFWFDEASEQWNRLADASKEIKEKIRAGEIQTKQHTTFGIGTVFDIGQTDCPPEDYPKVCDMGFASESHARLFDALVNYAESRNISVNIKSLPSITTRGYYNRGDNSITLSDKLNDSMKLSVMSHELAHAIMHGSEDAAELSTFQKEIEADSLSLMFRQHLGITEIEDVRQKHLQDSYKQYIDLANSSNSGEYQSLSEILDNVNKAYLSIVDDFNSSINNYLNLEKENRISEGRLTTGLQLPFVSSNTNSIDIINDGAEKVNTVQVKAVEAFSNKIDDFLEGKLKPREQIFVCKTTNAMKMCGANELNVVINQKTVEKIIDTGWAMSSHNSHSLSIEVLKEMPAQLENPIMIFEGSHKGSIVAVTELFNDKQEQIVISCELDSGSKWNKINRITSMYGKGNIRAYLRNQIEDNKLLGCNKIIANKTLQSLGLQLPQEETFIDYSSAVKQISSIEKAQLPTTITNADRNVIANEMFETPGLRLPRVGTSIEKNNEVNKMLHSTIHNSNGLAGLQLPGENTSIDYTISITDNSKNVNREFDSDIGVNMKKTIVVNLFAGPGAGKTTCAWEIASELKKRGIETEYVSEYAKELVWDNDLEMLDGSLEHQRILYNEQERRVQRLLGKVDVVVTDSPAILSHFYLKEAKNANEGYHQKREAAIAEYNEKVASGEIEKPSNIERYIKRAMGNPEVASVQAARRALEKRGYIQNDKGEWIKSDTSLDDLHNVFDNVLDKPSLSDVISGEELKQPQLDIGNIQFENEDGQQYYHFTVNVNDYNLEGLFRIHDPANGSDMKLVSVETYNRAEADIISEHWEELESKFKELATEELKMLDKKAISEYLENEEELPVDILCDESKLQWVSFSCNINDVEKTKDLLEALQNEEKQVVSIQNIDNGCRLVHIDSEMNITPVNNMVFMSPEGAMKEIYSNANIAKAVDYDSMLQAADKKRLTALSKANNEKFPYVKVNWSDNSELSSHGYLNYNMANNLSKSLNENNQQEGKIEKTNLTLFLDGNTSIQLDMSLGDESGGLTEHLNQLLQENSISSETSLQSLKSFLKERGLLSEITAASSEAAQQLSWEDSALEL